MDCLFCAMGNKPVPSDTVDVTVIMDGKPVIWRVSKATYKTILNIYGEIPPIDIRSSNGREQVPS